MQHAALGSSDEATVANSRIRCRAAASTGRRSSGQPLRSVQRTGSADVTICALPIESPTFAIGGLMLAFLNGEELLGVDLSCTEVCRRVLEGGLRVAWKMAAQMNVVNDPTVALKRGYFLLNTDGGILRRSRSEDPLTQAAIGGLLRTRRMAPVTQFSEPIGLATHNAAEYVGLIKGLKLAREHGVRHIRIYMDSELVVDQVNGRSKIKEAHLRELHSKAHDLLALFDYRISWVPRELNSEADKLVRDALAGL